MTRRLHTFAEGILSVLLNEMLAFSIPVYYSRIYCGAPPALPRAEERDLPAAPQFTQLRFSATCCSRGAETSVPNREKRDENDQDDRRHAGSGLFHRV